MARVYWRAKRGHEGKRKEAPEHGSWWADYTGATGKRVQERLPTARTQAEAREQLHLLADRAWRIRKGLEAAPAAPARFSTVAEEYIAAKASTLAGAHIRGDLRRHLVPYFSGKTLSEVTPGQVEDFASHMLAEGHAPGTVRLYVSRLAAVYRWAAQHRRFSGPPPTKLARPVRVPRRLPVVIPAEELRAILAHAGRWRLLLAFAATTGARKGELAGLLWTDLELVPGRARWHRRHNYDTDTTKGRHEDVVPLPEALAEELRAAKLHATSRHVFLARTGRPFGRGWRPSLAFANAQRRAGLPGHYTLKHLRSTFAASVGSLDAAQELLGHTDARVTRQHYRAARAERWRDDVERVAAQLLTPDTKQH